MTIKNEASKKVRCITPIDLTEKINALLQSKLDDAKEKFAERLKALIEQYDKCTNFEERVAVAHDISQLYDAFIYLEKGYIEAQAGYTRTTDSCVKRNDDRFQAVLNGESDPDY